MQSQSLTKSSYRTLRRTQSPRRTPGNKRTSIRNRCIWCRELYELKHEYLTGDLLRLAFEYHEISILDAERIAPHVRDIIANKRPLTRQVAYQFEAAFFLMVGIWKRVPSQREDWWRVNRKSYLSYEEQVKDRLAYIKLVRAFKTSKAQKKKNAELLRNRTTPLLSPFASGRSPSPLSSSPRKAREVI
jgi:plasmid maintenance system antidote protein VapI